MSDFIKINFLGGDTITSQAIIRRIDIVEMTKARHRAPHHEYSYFIERIVRPARQETIAFEITGEEYDRLCKELGVE